MQPTRSFLIATHIFIYIKIIDNGCSWVNGPFKTSTNKPTRSLFKTYGRLVSIVYTSTVKPAWSFIFHHTEIFWIFYRKVKLLNCLSRFYCLNILLKLDNTTFLSSDPFDLAFLPKTQLGVFWKFISVSQNNAFKTLINSKSCNLFDIISLNF